MWSLKKGDVYFKARKIIHMKFQNFAIYSFQFQVK